jgi:ketosteroid isomerase-like protein
VKRKHPDSASAIISPTTMFFAELDGQGVVAQSGYQYRQKYIILFRVFDGRIGHWREYLNSIPLQEAIASMQ